MNDSNNLEFIDEFSDTARRYAASDASDASAQQIGQALPHPRDHYRVAAGQRRVVMPMTARLGRPA
jgi:hypothetical protein